ncbi:MAG: alpha-ketoglutarate-dependent taurine dioxygenase [Crocinitomix sp.]|jgi:alpha-ketoglutarate-dependent taurine dioxygenase
MKDKLSSLKSFKAKSASNLERVTSSILDTELGFPLMFSTAFSDTSISGWMQKNRALIDAKLKEHGAILFRGFHVNSIDRFQGFMNYFEQEALEYKLRSSPRHAVGDKVYISTKYPSEYAINMHSESSYSPNHPNKIIFCCVDAADEGGETPIADNRKVLNAISDQTKEKFVDHGVKYRRFFSNGSGMSWHEAFQTEDKNIVEEECHSMGIDYKWQNENDLVLVWNKKAIWSHPETEENIWFNHGFFFNRLAPGYEDLNAIVEEDKLPNNTFFGDGKEISQEEINEIYEAYQKSTIRFKWEKGDVLLLDNMLMSHGRNPYKGSRNIIVSMT